MKLSPEERQLLATLVTVAKAKRELIYDNHWQRDTEVDAAAKHVADSLVGRKLASIELGYGGWCKIICITNEGRTALAEAEVDDLFYSHDHARHDATPELVAIVRGLAKRLAELEART